MSPRVSISFHLKTFRSKVTKVISVYYSDVFCKLENERLKRIFRSVLPEKRFIGEITMQFAAGGENRGDMSSVTSE